LSLLLQPWVVVKEDKEVEGEKEGEEGTILLPPGAPTRPPHN